ncbi:MAG: hypothetical protein JNK57_15985 [Planctomycetaceae bacterium]|nr:hypothetical protein [Planctomycetaceae bacterium]
MKHWAVDFIHWPLFLCPDSFANTFFSAARVGRQSTGGQPLNTVDRRTSETIHNRDPNVTILHL